MAKSVKKSYQKLYLVQPEIYEQLMSKLGDMEKSEIIELNEQYDNIPEDSQKINDSIGNVAENEQEKIIDNVQPTVNENVMIQSPTSVDVSTQITPSADQLLQEPQIVKNMKTKMASQNIQKPKKFWCEICQNKGFTRKYSLKRHIERFHDSKLSNENRAMELRQTSEPQKGSKRKFSDEIAEDSPTTSFKRPKIHSLKRKLAIDEKSPVNNSPLKRGRWINFR